MEGDGKGGVGMGMGGEGKGGDGREGDGRSCGVQKILKIDPDASTSYKRQTGGAMPLIVVANI